MCFLVTGSKQLWLLSAHDTVCESTAGTCMKQLSQTWPHCKVNNFWGCSARAVFFSLCFQLSVQTPISSMHLSPMPSRCSQGQVAWPSGNVCEPPEILEHVGLIPFHCQNYFWQNTKYRLEVYLWAYGWCDIFIFGSLEFIAAHIWLGKLDFGASNAIHLLYFWFSYLWIKWFLSYSC